MKKKSGQFHAFRGLVMFLMLVSIGCFSISIVRDIGTYVALNQNIRTNSQKRDQLVEKKESLETEKTNLSNPDYAEFVARGKYLVTKEGEQIFKFPAIDKNPATQEE